MTTKSEAEKKIKKLIQESDAKIKEAMKIADEHGLEFDYEPERIGTYYGKGYTTGSSYSGERFTADEETGLAEGEWYPSSWSSSSIHC